MRRTRIAALTAAGALAAAGSGVAVATTRSDDAKEREQAVLADAAKRLNVEPSELRDALSEAENAQLDADVKAGRLTQEQADAIKERRKAGGTVLGVGPGEPGDGPRLHFRGGPAGGPGDLMGAAAKAIGISQDELFAELRDGKKLSEVAKDHGKSFDDVKAAVKAELKKHLDEAVKNGPLTQEQADQMLSRLTESLDDFGSFREHRFGGPPPDRPSALLAPPPRMPDPPPGMPWS